MVTTADVPGRWALAINGVGYHLAEDGEDPAIVHQSVRTQAEQHGGASVNIGEATVNPEGFWRRSRDGWHQGAGQTYGDRDESDSLRFRTSRGVDVLSTRHQVSLLHSTTVGYDGTNLGALIQAGSHAYLIDGTTVKFTATPLTVPWSMTTVTGTPAAPTDLAVINNTVYIAAGSDGIYSTAVGGGTASSYATGTASNLAVAMGRLMAWEGSALYNITAAGAFPAALITFASGQIRDVSGAANHIYIAVTPTTGSPSLIYKTSIKPDGTALDVPTVAGELPYGETAQSVFGYLGFLLIRTSLGIRLATIDSNGNLVMGSVIPVIFQATRTVWAAESRFVWFPYSEQSPSDWSGIARVDLSATTLPNTPAYASDLFATSAVLAQGQAVLSFTGRRVFDVNNDVYVESASSYVTSGTIHSGLLAIDLADTKTPVAMDVEGGGLDASETIVEAISVDRGATFTTVGTWDSQADGEVAVSGIAASRQFELRTTLNGDGTATPVLYRHTLKVEPNVNQNRLRLYQLALMESVVDYTGSATGRTPATDLAALEALQEARTVVEVQEGSETFNATIRDVDFRATTRCQSAADGSFNGVARVVVKELP